MLYLVKEITGGGYDQDDVGIFDSMIGACDAIVAHLDKNGLEAAKFCDRMTAPGDYKVSFIVNNKPYSLSYVITPKQINVLTV